MDAAAEFKHANIVKRLRQERADRGLDHQNFFNRFSKNKVPKQLFKAVIYMYLNKVYKNT
mgnify:CR=1 FL=1